MANTVDVEFHLIVEAHEFREYTRGDVQHLGKAKVRVTKGKPSVAPTEVAIAFKLSLPVALFVRPQLKAEITIPPESAPFVITPRIQHGIAESIRAQTGFAVQIAAMAKEL